MSTDKPEKSNTKNLGERKKVPVRLGPETIEYAEKIGNLASVPVNTVIAIGVVMLAAQFAPLLSARGLSLDLLEEEVRLLFAEARRVVKSRPAPPRKIPK